MIMAKIDEYDKYGSRSYKLLYYEGKSGNLDIDAIVEIIEPNGIFDGVRFKVTLEPCDSNSENELIRRIDEVFRNRYRRIYADRNKHFKHFVINKILPNDVAVRNLKYTMDIY